MPSTAELRQRLSEVFRKDQASVLSDAFTDAFATQRRMLDEIGGLRGEVRKLATAQKQLAAAQERTEARVEQLAEAQQRLAEAQRRTEARVEQLAAAQERTEARVEQLAEEQALTQKALRNLARQVGGLSDKLGGSLEDLALETVPAVLAEEWGLSDIECSRELVEVDGEEKEIDLLLRGTLPDGSSLLVLGEVKSRLTGNEVRGFLSKAEKVAEALGERQMRVLFFGFQANLEARDLIKRSGAYMLFSNGRFLKTYNPRRS